MPFPLLKITDLACRRGSEWLFRGLCFAIFPGQMLWLRGANGSGKTTLMRTVCGLTEPDEGLVEHLSEARRVVYVGHLNAMKDDLTVFESLQFVARLHGLPASRAQVFDALRLLGMHHRRHAAVRTLSQGQRRRAALARLALESQVSLWVLDEPFDALDTAGIAVVNGLLKQHLERGGGVLLTSHLVLESDGPQAQELNLVGEAHA